MIASLYWLADLSNISPGSLPTTAPTQGTVTNVFNIFLNILGAIALLVIVVAGLRYITAAGEPKKMADARTTIVFALLGLLIVIVAKAIVGFVVGRIS